MTSALSAAGAVRRRRASSPLERAASTSRLHSERLNAPPSTLRPPSRRTLMMCTSGAPCLSVSRRGWSARAGRIAAPASPISQTCASRRVGRSASKRPRRWS
eukprot:3760670-Prymnesium_polylepis.1